MNKTPRFNALKNSVWLVVLCAAWFAIGWVANIRFGNSQVRFIEAARKSIAKDSFFYNQQEDDLSYAAVRGMLSAIDDPYAELIEPEAAKGLVDTFAGKTGVAGLYAANEGGQVVVLIVFPEGPAAAAGVRVGDVILKIDGKPLDKDTDSSETGLLIRGEPGTTVSLEILRENKTLDFALVRQERKYVSWRMLPEGIGYISLSAFNEVATNQMKSAMQSLLAEQPEAVIWDLRSNEGGDMKAAQDIVGYFIEDGLLFSAELTQGRSVQFMAKGDALAPDLPLIVLVDETTYSAAETAAAVINERHRGITVGGVTYGKGLIQATMPFEDGSMLQMTIAKWLSPEGEWYHERGVPPQVAVSDDPATEEDEVLRKAVELILEMP